MDQVTQFYQNNSSIISTLAFLAVILVLLYVFYSYLYPANDPTYTQFIKGEMDARKPMRFDSKVPDIYTGGDFTLSFWVYIDDWNYKVSSNKFLFAISPENLTTTSRSPLVGVLTPMQNRLMVRGAVVGNSVAPAPGSAPSSGSAVPDINTEVNLQNLLNQQTSMSMFQNTVDVPCDIKEVPIQRWSNITIVSSGRILDVYIDGKLGRSCVLENVLEVPRGPLRLRLGESGGFGGRYSSVQMWSQQLTPDVIYGIYQMGPTQTQHDIFTEVAKYLNLNVSFTGPASESSASASLAPGQAANPFSQMYDMANAAGDRMYNEFQESQRPMMGGGLPPVNAALAARV
jgi:hypothetical protein